jgi:hypothetical protein
MDFFRRFQFPFLNFFNNIRLGVTGRLYGQLSLDEVADISRATADISRATADVSLVTATSSLPRFSSYDTNPSYKKLYDTDFTYDNLDKEKMIKICKEMLKNDKNKPTHTKILNNIITKIENIEPINIDELKKIATQLIDFNTDKLNSLTQYDLSELDIIKKKIYKQRNYAKEYTKDLDTTQAAFIVFKIDPNTYKIYLIYTRDTRIEFIKGKIPTILLRVLYSENFKYGEHSPQSYICVGTVDANNDKDQKQTAFHEDNFPRYFISDPLEEDFKNLYDTLFGKNSLPHCGILDFQTLLDVVTATTGRDSDNEVFSLLPGANGNFAPFFAYLNSLISHATPDFIDLEKIKADYRMQNIALPQEVIEFVERYNTNLQILRENNRKFRRELLSFTPMTQEYTRFTEDIITKFREKATSVIVENRITKNLIPYLIGKSIYDKDITKKILFENDQFVNDFERNNIECFVYMEKTFNGAELSNKDLNNPNLNFLIQLKNQMFAPIGDRLLLGRADSSAILLQGQGIVTDAGGKRNKSKQRQGRNTRKKLKKMRSSQRKQNKKRRSRK